MCRAEAAGGDLVGVIVTMGGQTPLQLAQGLAAAGVPLLGTPPDAIDLAEDRGRFGTVLEQCGLDAPPWGQAATVDQALAVADRVGYPVLVRPSYVLGGRSMEVCYDADAPGPVRRPGPDRKAPAVPSWSTGSWRTRSRSTSTPSATPEARCWSAG